MFRQMEPPSEVYADKELPSMPKAFSANGYQTATFHTNNVMFWNRDQLYKAIGWDKYYDDTFFGKEDPVAFGPSDEVLYAKSADELARIATNRPAILCSAYFNVRPSSIPYS